MKKYHCGFFLYNICISLEKEQYKMGKNKKNSEVDEDFIPGGEDEQGWIAGTHLDCSRLQHYVNTRLYEMFRVPIALVLIAICLLMLALTKNTAISAVLAIPFVLFVWLEFVIGDLRDFKRKHASAIRYLKNTPIKYILKPMKKNKVLPPPVDYVLTDEKNIARGKGIFEFTFDELDSNDRVNMVYTYFKDKVAAFPALMNCDEEYYDAKSIALLCSRVIDDCVISDDKVIEVIIGMYDNGNTQIADYYSVSNEKHRHLDTPDTPEVIKIRQDIYNEIQSHSSQTATDEDMITHDN